MTFAIGQRVFLKMTFKYFKIGHVEHWLNGYKVVEFDIWTHEWKEIVANSKFNKIPGFGTGKKGHIALQDHGDGVWYRNIKIREI